MYVCYQRVKNNNFAGLSIKAKIGVISVLLGNRKEDHGEAQDRKGEKWKDQKKGGG